MMRRVYSHGELLIVVLAALTPLFVLAKHVDWDEFVKSTGGIFLSGTVAAIITVYKTWAGRQG